MVSIKDEAERHKDCDYYKKDETCLWCYRYDICLNADIVEILIDYLDEYGIKALMELVMRAIDRSKAK